MSNKNKKNDNAIRKKKIQESIKEASIVDINVDIQIPKYQGVKEDRKHKCTCCGNSWDIQKGNFSESQSVLYQSNNGYITVCNNCRDEYYYQLIDLYTGNEEKAIEHMCKQFGWIYDFNALVAARQISRDRSRISNYLAKKNLSQTTKHGYTDIDTVKNEFLARKSNVIKSPEHLEELKEEGLTNTSTASVERWGFGLFSDEEYKVLDDHYKTLKKANPNCDSNQEIFIKDLCYTKLQQMKALKNNNFDDFDKATKLYRETFKQARLRIIQESDSSEEETLGVTLAVISKYTPEEYYKNKDLYKDFDGLGSYIKRFIFRPIKNLMTGSKDRDEEYCVKDGDYDE